MIDFDERYFDEGYKQGKKDEREKLRKLFFGIINYLDAERFEKELMKDEKGSEQQ